MEVYIAGTPLLFELEPNHARAARSGALVVRDSLEPESADGVVRRERSENLGVQCAEGDLGGRGVDGL